MEHPVLNAIRRASFEPLAWFAPDPHDGVPRGARFIILIGNAGPQMFRRFSRERDTAQDGLDDWCRDAVQALARDLDADSVFPFDKPPLPFLTWARRGGAGHVSPLGLNIHPHFGLWYAYRAALLFPVAFDLPPLSASSHPCETCPDKPCLSACLVGAFTHSRYDLAACVDHIKAGSACMDGGCLARHACPVGKAHAYAPEQARFHMKAFREAHRH